MLIAKTAFHQRTLQELEALKDSDPLEVIINIYPFIEKEGLDYFPGLLLVSAAQSSIQLRQSRGSNDATADARRAFDYYGSQLDTLVLGALISIINKVDNRDIFGHLEQLAKRKNDRLYGLMGEMTKFIPIISSLTESESIFHQFASMENLSDSHLAEIAQKMIKHPYSHFRSIARRFVHYPERADAFATLDMNLRIQAPKRSNAYVGSIKYNQFCLDTYLQLVKANDQLLDGKFEDVDAIFEIHERTIRCYQMAYGVAKELEDQQVTPEFLTSRKEHLLNHYLHIIEGFLKADKGKEARLFLTMILASKPLYSYANSSPDFHLTASKAYKGYDDAASQGHFLQYQSLSAKTEIEKW